MNNSDVMQIYSDHFMTTEILFVFFMGHKADS